MLHDACHLKVSLDEVVLLICIRSHDEKWFKRHLKKALGNNGEQNNWVLIPLGLGSWPYPERSRTWRGLGNVLPGASWRLWIVKTFRHKHTILLQFCSSAVLNPMLVVQPLMSVVQALAFKYCVEGTDRSRTLPVGNCRGKKNLEHSHYIGSEVPEKKSGSFHLSWIALHMWCGWRQSMRRSR